MRFKVAIVQFAVEQFAPEKNLKKAEQFIKKAGEKNAKIVVFPEDFITGPVFGLKQYVDFNGKYKTVFQHLAKNYRIDIVTGSFIEADKNAWYNASYYINYKGKIRSSYRKINLWRPEKKYLASGNEVSVFNTKYCKCSIAICFDLFFPEIFRKASERGARIVFCPSYWCIEDAGIGLSHSRDAAINAIDSMCVARAFESNLIIVFANAANELKYKNIFSTLAGHSQITVPFKGALEIFRHNREAMLVQEINTNILKDAESVYKTRADLKKKIYC